ncbi:HAD-IC family P-type ATPase [Legionella tunisiensis]|uniref:HAD-IC family P-type ATPase n=1 Tax=Legionella tunisiensis TaxID=1034944 RepID=UPI0002DD3E54|nr:HAD-IC family P-type ATPase [Legionella tunisiensis]
MFGIFILSLAYPPSLFLTVILTAVTSLTTAYTGRHYLSTFLRNLRNKNINDMSSTVSLGWLLSLIHTLYHSITMPLASSFSMVFMSFIMPVMLIAIVNGMDEIKRLVLQKSKTMHLKGMKSLFPQMAEQYSCYQLSEEEQGQLIVLMETWSADVNVEAFLIPTQSLLDKDRVMQPKQSLKKGMLIQVNVGECFPVDCTLIQGETLVDASLLTGELQQPKQRLDKITAGAINLGQTVTVYVENDSYNSSINKILFRSNRAPKASATIADSSKFTSLYISLIIVSIVASAVTPLALGVFTVPLVLKNITGILFAVCPCTIAIAHQLPQLLSIYQRNNKNILLRNENLNTEEIHTVVFDKTGTLTTGKSQVESYVGLNDATWQRIHLLEKIMVRDIHLLTQLTVFMKTRLPRVLSFRI